MPSTSKMTLIIIALSIIIALIGLIYNALVKRIDTKVDKELYLQTIKNIQEALDKINGIAVTMKQVVHDLTNIQEKFLSIKEYEYKQALHEAMYHVEQKKPDNKT